MSQAREFGVQSYCFREFKDNAIVADKVKEIGLNSIEVCAVHADFNDLEGWKRIVEIYRDKGVSIVSIGVQTFVGDESEREWFQCAAAAGAKHISAQGGAKAIVSKTHTIPSNPRNRIKNIALGIAMTPKYQKTFGKN